MASQPVETRFAHYMSRMVVEGLDPSRVNFNEIPEGLRPDAKRILSGLVSKIEPINPPQTEQKPQAPAIIIPRTPEHEALIEKLGLKEQYQKEIERQRAFQLLEEGQEMPDFDSVLRVFGPEVLTASEKMRDPRLIMVTRGKSPYELLSAMHGNTPNVWRYSNKHYYDEYADHKPELWGAYLLGAGPEGFEKLTLGEEKEASEAYKVECGLSGMDRLKFVHWQMQRKFRGEEMGSQRCTTLDEDPASDESRMLEGLWSEEKQRLSFFATDNHVQRPHRTENQFIYSVGGTL